MTQFHASALGGAGLVLAVMLAANEVIRPIANAVLDPPVTGSGVAQSSGRPGDVIVVEWTIQKRVDCPGLNWRHWSGPDGIDIRGPVMPTTLPVSRVPRTYYIDTQIPDATEIVPGEYRLSIEGSYTCGQRELPFRLGPVIITIEERQP